jgi:predicted phage terminase large subunit-like protein
VVTAPPRVSTPDLGILRRASAEAITHAAARQSLTAYIRLQREGDYQQARFQHHLVSTLEAVERGEKRRVVIIMPPGHTKSTHGSIHLPPWYLGRNPNNDVIAISYGDELAVGFGRKARDQMASNNLNWPFPKVRVSRSSSAVDDWRIAYPFHGGYRASGIGGSITGHRADLIVIDDPVKNWQEAQSETMRDHMWNWYQSVAYTRLQPMGAIVMIGTRWHEDDLIGRALAQEGAEWEVIHYPAEAEEDDVLGRAPGEWLWPEYFPPWRYEETKRDVGSTMWTTLYQGAPFPVQGGTFKREDWQRYNGLPKMAEAVITVDSAFKEGIQNDFSVFALWGSDGEGRYFVIDVWRKRVEFPGLIRAGYDLFYKWREFFLTDGRYAPHFKLAMHVEDAASGQSAIQMWQQPFRTASGTMLPRIPVQPYKLVGSKVARAEGVSPLVESHSVYVPEDAPWVAEFIDEHAAFPSGKHDDMVDTTSMALALLATRKRRGARAY